MGYSNSVSLMSFLIKLNNTRIKTVKHQESHEWYENFECTKERPKFRPQLMQNYKQSMDPTLGKIMHSGVNNK